MNLFLAALCAAFFAAVIVLAYLAVRDDMATTSCRIDDKFPAEKSPWINFWLHMLAMAICCLFLAVIGIANLEPMFRVVKWVYEWR